MIRLCFCLAILTMALTISFMIRRHMFFQLALMPLSTKGLFRKKILLFLLRVVFLTFFVSQERRLWRSRRTPLCQRRVMLPCLVVAPQHVFNDELRSKLERVGHFVEIRRRSWILAFREWC